MALTREQLNQANAEMKKAEAQDACLVIFKGTPQGHRFFIAQSEMILGRDPAVEMSIADASVSRKHAKISRQGNKVLLTDLGSSNGTFVNDQKIEPNQPTELRKDDVIKFGNIILKFYPAGAVDSMIIGNIGEKADTDALTKIFNKGYLLQKIEEEFSRARAMHVDLTVVYFDLDHFKKVNDNFGHDAGDYVLKEFTQLVKSTHLRPKDIFCRFGGEEFVVILPNTNTATAKELAEKIRAAVETYTFIYEGKRLPVTSSLGVATLTPATTTAQQLLKDADKALYSAKQSGRNRVVVAT